MKNGAISLCKVAGRFRRSPATAIAKRLCKTMAVGLVMVSAIICCAAVAGGNEQLSETLVQAQKDFEKRLEKLMEDWPEGDPSNELPLDMQVHAEIRRICDEIRQSTEEELKLGSWPNAELELRSISYVLRHSKQCVEALYSSRSDKKTLNPEVVSERVKFEIRDGELRFRPPSGKRVSAFADVIIPTLRQYARSIPQSATYAVPISWPVSDEAHQKLSKGVTRLLVSYVKELRDFLADSDKVTGQIEQIKYAFWFKEGYANVRVTFDIKGTDDRFVNPGVELDYKGGKFRLCELISAGWSGGVEYVGVASGCAMDYAVGKWVREFPTEHAFDDARVGPPFKWVEVSKDLPEGMGRITQIRRRCHPFLGEYHRKYRIKFSDGRSRTFRLPTDGGGVMKTDVFLVEANGKRFIRLKDNRFTDIAITVESLSICPPLGLGRGEFMFSFNE